MPYSCSVRSGQLTYRRFTNRLGSIANFLSPTVVIIGEKTERGFSGVSPVSGGQSII